MQVTSPCVASKSFVRITSSRTATGSCLRNFFQALTPGRNLIGVTDIDRGEGVVIGFCDKVHFAVPFPAIRVKARPHQFDADEVLRQVSLRPHKPEGDSVPDTVVDAVDLPVLPAPAPAGSRKRPGPQRDLCHPCEVDIIPDVLIFDPERFLKVAVRVWGGNVCEEILEEPGQGLSGS